MSHVVNVYRPPIVLQRYAVSFPQTMYELQELSKMPQNFFNGIII
jgi:hypothetical protein